MQNNTTNKPMEQIIEGADGYFYDIEKDAWSKPMEKNKTAVEWYNSKVIELMTQREQGNIDVLEFRNQLDLFFAEAKAMEKQQIVDAVDGFPLDKRHLDGDQYYKKTYGKD